MGTGPESYIELIDSFTGISRKMDLKGNYQEALRRLEDAVLVESCHMENRPSDEEGGTPPAPEQTGTDTPEITPAGDKAGTKGTASATDKAASN